MLKVMQIAMNTVDMAGSLRLYSEALGFRNAFGQTLWGDLIGLQGLPPDSRALVWWVVGAHPDFQLEFFHHTQPAIRPKRADWRPNDAGWNGFAIKVAALDRCAEKLDLLGIPLLGPVTQANGRREAAFLDPYAHVVVQLFEDEAASEGPMVACATATVTDLGSARHFYADVLRLDVSAIEVCEPTGDEARWNLGGAARTRFRLHTADIEIEIVQYVDNPGRPRPSDYRISDQGIPNIALGTPSFDEAKAAFARLASVGLIPPRLFRASPVMTGYITAPERELEIFAIPAEALPAFGFAPGLPFLNDAMG